MKRRMIAAMMALMLMFTLSVTSMAYTQQEKTCSVESGSFGGSVFMCVRHNYISSLFQPDPRVGKT